MTFHRERQYARFGLGSSRVSSGAEWLQMSALWASAVRIVDGALGVAVPMAILLGLVWGDLFAAMSLGQIAVRANGKPLTPAAVQGVIGDALGDSTIALALWSPERAGYVDVDGAPLELPRDTRGRAASLTSHTATGRSPR